MHISSRDFVGIGRRVKFVVLAMLAVGLLFEQGAQAGPDIKTAAPAALRSAPVNATPAMVAAASLEAPTRTFSLANLSAQSGPLRLTRIDGSAVLSIPVSRRETIKTAALHLVLTNSIALNERSQLVVRLNNHTVAQLQLSARQPEVSAEIHLPVELLQPGYNQLGFTVAQHSQDSQCEDVSAPELWTEIDTSASTLTLQTAIKPLTPQTLQLSVLDEVFDPKLQALPKVNIVTATHPDSDAALKLGATLVQGIALKMQYLMPTIRQVDAQASNGNGGGVTPGLALTALSGADNLLVGTVSALKPYLDAHVVQQIKGSFLGVYAMPDGQHIMLVVSGRDAQEVQRAAQAFAWQRLEFPAQNQWNISAFTPPNMPRYTPQATVAEQGLYSFKQLGFSTSFLSIGAAAELKINLPPDVYAQEDAQMEFRLNFAQGAKMNGDGMVNLYLNDVFQRSLVVDERQGGYYENYRLSLPLSNFRPGTNVLSFRPLFVAQHQCAPSGPSMMTLFDSSSVKVPYIYRFAQLPDLARFASNAFPYVSHSDGRALSLQVSDADSATIASAWMLLGKLAQIQNVPLDAAQITYGVPAAKRHVLVIGNLETLPHDLLVDAPWKLDSDLRFASSSIPLPSPSQESGWFRQQFQTLTHTNRNNPDATYLNSAASGDATLTHQLLVMQFRSRKLGDVTTTIFTAANPLQLQEGMHQLVSANYWNNMAGDVALLTLGKPDLATQRIGPTYDEGHIGKAEYLGYMASKYPWTLYGLMVVVLGLLSLLCVRALRRYLRRRTAVGDV